MALPTDTPFNVTPTYVVYRDLQPGEPFDPTSALLFFPPKGSDELFDALRIAFPHLKTHSERMRDAIIQFLLDERQDEQLHASPAMTMDNAPTWPSMSSSGSASVFSSPDLLDLPTPTSFANSPQAQTPQLARQPSAATSSKTTPPSLEQMTGVFSLSAEAQPKQRVRRKMTEAEKAEYRKRRIVKACDKCAKRKRKCPHNQSQMEDISTAKSVAKISKPVSHRSSKPAQQTSDKLTLAAANQFAAAEGFDFTTDLDMGSFQTFDDFPMFDDSFAPEFTVDNLLHFEQPGPHFQPHDYFSPILAQSEYRSSGGIEHSSSTHFQLQSPPQQVPGGTGEFGQFVAELSPGQNSRHRPSQSGSQQQPRRLSMRVSHGAEAQNTLLLEIGQNHNGIPQQDGERDADHNTDAFGAMREGMREGQQGTQPTHTSYVHKAAGRELYRSAEANGGLKAPRLIPPTLAQTTLRLTGTTRALRAFANLAGLQGGQQSQRPRVSIQHAAIVLRNACEHQLGVGAGSPELYATSSLQTNRHAVATNREGLPQRPPSRAVAPELRLQTSTSVSQSGGIRFGSAALLQGRPHASCITQSHATISLPSSDQKSQEIQHPKSHSLAISLPAISQASGEASTTRKPVLQSQGRTQSTLGEGIASLGSISTELYMLRRRPRKSGTNQNHRHTSTAVNNENASLAAHADGGAYPRLQPRDSHAAANNSGRTPAIASTPAYIVGTLSTTSTELARASDHMRYRDHHGRTDLYGRAAETKTPHEDRLRDYFKVKDHLGRNFTATTAIMLFLGICLATAVLSAGAFFSPALACFAAYACSCLSTEMSETRTRLPSIVRRVMEPRSHQGKEVENQVALKQNQILAKWMLYPLAHAPLRLATLV